MEPSKEASTSDVDGKKQTDWLKKFNFWLVQYDESVSLGIWETLYTVPDVVIVAFVPACRGFNMKKNTYPKWQRWSFHFL